MKNPDLYETLRDEGYIDAGSFEKIKKRQENQLFSLHWELKTLLYLGVMLLSTGLGILIYKNIDTIGHQVILLIIAIISAGCFVYCAKHRSPFSRTQVKSEGALFDYLLLLGCLSFLTFVGYLQVQYTVFGTNYGMATFIPMLVLFFVAYVFDHLGILNMAIANLAIWMGVSITPARLLSSGNFSNERIIFTYLALGLILITTAYLTEKFSFKKHFRFSYLHFGIHISFIALLAGYFNVYNTAVSLFWIPGIALLAFYLYHVAIKNRSFYFLLLVVIYSYIALSGLLINGLINTGKDDVLYLIPIYFIGSAVGLIRILLILNKKLKAL